MFPSWPWWLGSWCVAIGAAIVGVARWCDLRARCSDDRGGAALLAILGAAFVGVGLAAWALSAAVKIVFF